MRHRESTREVKEKYLSKFEWLAERCCKFTGAEKFCLNTSTREAEYAKARCIIAVLMNRHNTIMDWMIGELLNRDHATIHAAKVRFRNFYDTDSQFRIFVDRLELDYIKIYGTKTDANSIRQCVSAKIFGSPWRSMEEILKVLIR
jgi:chromosomal replication initiation ATPase DnaA